MSRILKTRRAKALVGSMAILAVAAVAAFAYYSSTVTAGTGNATAGNTAANLTATVTDVTNALNPGAGTQNVPITITNESSTESARYDHVTLAVTDVKKASVSDVANCATSNFTAVGTSAGSGSLLAKSGTHSETGTVEMNETGLNQDNCKGDTVVLTATPVVTAGS